MATFRIRDFTRIVVVACSLSAMQLLPLDGAGPWPSAALGAQEDVGTLLVAHGGSEEWNARVHTIADLVDTGGPLEVSFLMGEAASRHRFQDGVRRLAGRGATRIVVVPLLASSHSGHYEQIRWLASETDEVSEALLHHMHAAGIERPDDDVPLRVTAAIDQSLEVAEVLSDRALALAKNAPEQALFLVGHGPGAAVDYAHWMENLRVVADSVAARTGVRDVKIGLLRDDAPEGVRAEAVRRIREIISLQHASTGRPVVVVPILVSKGRISTVKLPDDLEGLAIAYDGEGLVPHPAIARWVERRVRESSDFVVDAGVRAGSASPGPAAPSVRYEGMDAEPEQLSLTRGAILEIRNAGDTVLVFEGNGLYPGEVAVSPGASVTVAANGAPGTYRLVDERGLSGTATVVLEAGREADPLLDRRNAVGALTVLEGHVRAASALHRRALLEEGPNAQADLARAGTHAGHPWNELLRGEEPDALALQGLLRESGHFEALDRALATFVAGAGDSAVSLDSLGAAYEAVLISVERARSAIAGEAYRRPSFRAGVVGFVLETAAAEYATAAEGGRITVEAAGSAGRDDYVEYQDARAFVAAARELIEPLRPGMTPDSRRAFDSLDRVVFRTLDPPAPEAPLHPDVVRTVVRSVLEGLAEHQLFHDEAD